MIYAIWELAFHVKPIVLWYVIVELLIVRATWPVKHGFSFFLLQLGHPENDSREGKTQL